MTHRKIWLTSGTGADSIGLAERKVADAVSQPAFYGNVTVSDGPAPARAYFKELLPDVLDGRIEPGRVFERVVGLDALPDGCRAMAEREAIKVMVQP